MFGASTSSRATSTPVLAGGRWLKRIGRVSLVCFLTLSPFGVISCTTGGSGDRSSSGLDSSLKLIGLKEDSSDHPQSSTIEGVTTSARILSDSDALKLYGVDLAHKGIQAVWMRISNKTRVDQWMLAAHLDPDYYTADEAAYLFRHHWGGLGYSDLQQRFRDLTMRARVGAGETHEGHVLVPRKEGGRYVEITTNGQGKVREFGFPLRTPDGHFDFERMNLADSRKSAGVPDLSRAQLRARLEKLPATVTNEKGTTNGDPINLVIVGESSRMMSAMSECGWAFTHRIDGTTVWRMIRAAVAGNPYLTAPVSSLYVFGRKQDVAFQRARTNLSQRNHMRLWRAPFTTEGKPVWIGQVSRDIGIKLTDKSPTLTTHVIDPMVDESRQFVLESLLLRFRISDFGFTRASAPATQDHPRQNLTGDSYFTDGLRLVVFLSSDPVNPESVHNLGWDQTRKGPIEFGQSQKAR